jgi:hypothetical protein
MKKNYLIYFGKTNTLQLFNLAKEVLTVKGKFKSADLFIIIKEIGLNEERQIRKQLGLLTEKLGI